MCSSALSVLLSLKDRASRPLSSAELPLSASVDGSGAVQRVPDPYLVKSQLHLCDICDFGALTPLVLVPVHC